MFDLQLRALLGGQSPDLNTIQLVIVRPKLQQIAAALSQLDTSGVLSSVYVHSYQNPLVWSDTTLETDLIESTYPGYSPQLLGAGWITGIGLTGEVVTAIDLPVPFVCDGDPAGELLAGLYLTDHLDSENLIGGGGPGTPLLLANGQIIPVTLSVQIGNS